MNTVKRLSCWIKRHRYINRVVEVNQKIFPFLVIFFILLLLNGLIWNISISDFTLLNYLLIILVCSAIINIFSYQKEEINLGEKPLILKQRVAFALTIGVITFIVSLISRNSLDFFTVLFAGFVSLILISISLFLYE